MDVLSVAIDRTPVNWILDADIRSFFDGLSQEWLVRFLEHRIGDQRIIRLVRKWQAGVLEDGELSVSETSTPQGAVASPLFANVYLHYAFDLWANRWRRRGAKGNVIIGKRHFVAAWTELKPVSKVMSVTSSGGDYFGHTECETIEPQGPTELRTGVPTASCRRGD